MGKITIFHLSATVKTDNQAIILATYEAQIGLSPTRIPPKWAQELARSLAPQDPDKPSNRMRDASSNYAKAITLLRESIGVRDKGRRRSFYWRRQPFVLLDGKELTYERAKEEYSRIAPDDVYDTDFAYGVLNDSDGWKIVIQRLQSLRADASSLSFIPSGAHLPNTEEGKIIAAALDAFSDLRDPRKDASLDAKRKFKKVLDKLPPTHLHGVAPYLSEIFHLRSARSAMFQKRVDDFRPQRVQQDIMSPSIGSYQDELLGFNKVRLIRRANLSGLEQAQHCDAALFYFARALAHAAIGQRLTRVLDCAASLAGFAIEMYCKHNVVRSGSNPSEVIRSATLWFLLIINTMTASSIKIIRGSIFGLSCATVRRALFFEARNSLPEDVSHVVHELAATVSHHALEHLPNLDVSDVVELIRMLAWTGNDPISPGRDLVWEKTDPRHRECATRILDDLRAFKADKRLEQLASLNLVIKRFGVPEEWTAA